MIWTLSPFDSLSISKGNKLDRFQWGSVGVCNSVMICESESVLILKYNKSAANFVGVDPLALKVLNDII